MKNLRIIIIVICFISLYLGYLLYKEIQKPKISSIILPTFTFRDENDSVFAEGAWMFKSPEELFYKHPINAATILCNRNNNNCIETRERLDGRLGFTTIASEMITYEIKEWEPEQIIATANLPVATNEIRINRLKKSVMQLRTEKPDIESAASQPFIRELVDGKEAMQRFKELYEK